VVPGGGLLPQHLAGVGGEAGVGVAEVEPPHSQSALLEVIVQGMYSSLRELRNVSAKPPARAAWRVLGYVVDSVCNSARKRWTQRS
jgi:hypothetical protein